jgi:Fe-S oxidoreductase
MGVLDKLGFDRIRVGVAKARGGILYVPGCTTQKYLPDIAENYKSLLNDLGVPIRTTPTICCGRPLKEQGYTKEYQEHIAKTKKTLADAGVGQIVTNCSQCARTMAQDLGIEVKHTTDVIWAHRQKLQPFNSGEITYQDNCVGARKLGLTHQARDILVQTGFRVKEFSECKAGVRCCGGSCGLQNNASTVSVKLAQRRLRDAPAQTIVTDDPHCYIQLKRNTQNKEILELSETLVEI